MRFILALPPAILGMAVAAPAPEASAGLEARQISIVGLTFYGADKDAKYSISAPLDGSEFTISMRLHFISPGLCFRPFLIPSLIPPLFPSHQLRFLIHQAFHHPIPLILPSSGSLLSQTHPLSRLPSYPTLPSDPSCLFLLRLFGHSPPCK